MKSGRASGCAWARTISAKAGIRAQPSVCSPPPGAHVVPFDLSGRIPVITGKLDGLPVRISVDTGSRVSLTLHSPFVRENGLVKRYDAAPEREPL